METFIDATMRHLLRSSLNAAELTAEGWVDTGEGPGSAETDHVSWLTIENQGQSVLEDVLRIRHHTLVPREIPIYSYIYDTKTGRLIAIPTATRPAARADIVGC